MFRVHVDAERCKGCALCIASCARSVLRMSKRLNSKGFHYPEAVSQDACTGCTNCAEICPDLAIAIGRDGGMPQSPATGNAKSGGKGGGKR